MIPEKLPGSINRLDELAHNLWWSWHEDARRLFRSLDYPLWNRSVHNPVKVLREVSKETLLTAASDPAFLTQYDTVLKAFDADMSAPNNWLTLPGGEVHGSLAYFSMEFAFHNSLPIYAGGLGILAGDICKEASDMALPMVGIGFMYPQRYFHQHISAEGWQEEIYERLNWPHVAIEQALKPDGAPCIVAVPLGDRAVLTNVWKVALGRVTLYLLDTGLEENAP